jgi:hypothetical protein
MNVKAEGGTGAQIGDELGPKGEVGDKAAVHHIKMDPLRPGPLYRGQGGGEIGKICGKQGGCKDSHTPIIAIPAVLVNKGASQNPDWIQSFRPAPWKNLKKLKFLEVPISLER